MINTLICKFCAVFTKPLKESIPTKTALNFSNLGFKNACYCGQGAQV